MGVLTTRPNATVSLGGAAITGAASAWQALADESDSTYIQLSAGDNPSLAFAEPTIPVGAVVRSARLRSRMKLLGDATQILTLDWSMRDPVGAANFNISANAQVITTWLTMTTTTVLVDQETDAHVAPTNIQVNVVAGTQSSFIQIAALYFDTVYVAQPVVTVSAPTGTVNFDSTPNVAWTTSLDTDGGIQTHFEVKLFDAATYGGGFSPTTSTPTASSGVVSSGWANWAPTSAVSNDTYRAYVRVAQTVNGVQHWSGWSYSQFILGADAPATPGLTVTAENSAGRIRLNLSSNSGAATTTDYEVQYSDDNVNWEGVRTSEAGGLVTASGGAGTTYDYEAPNGQLRRYRVRSRHIYFTPGGLLEGITVSAWTATGSATWTSTDFWVKSVADPSLNMVALPHSQPTSTRTSRRGLFQSLGAKYPIAVEDKRSSAAGEIVFQFETDSDRNRFEALLDESGFVLIQAPLGVFDWPDRYCSLGDYERERAFDKSFIGWTYDSVQWTEVERPVP